MWNPGFRYEDAQPARLEGFHRAFCVYSVFYRGTPLRPGLVLGLDRGAACTGMAFRISDREARETLRYVRQRELITGVYREARLPIRLQGERRQQVEAVTYITERVHPGYAGRLPLAMQARLIRAAVGKTGSNIDYALNTITHLQQMGVLEPNFARLVPLLGAVFRYRGLAVGHGAEEDNSLSRVGPVLAQQLARHPSPAPRIRRDQRKRYVYRERLAQTSDAT